MRRAAPKEKGNRGWAQRRGQTKVDTTEGPWLHPVGGPRPESRVRTFRLPLERTQGAAAEVYK